MMLTWKQAALPSPRRHWSGWFRPRPASAAKAVNVVALRFGFAPARFWQGGVLRHVRRVERSWDVAGQGGRAGRRFFRLQCADGSRWTLSQQLEAGIWQCEAAQ